MPLSLRRGTGKDWQTNSIGVRTGTNGSILLILPAACSFEAAAVAQVTFSQLFVDLL
jgi:hypothetical protein